MSDKDLALLREYQEKNGIAILSSLPSQSVETFSDGREDLTKLREDLTKFREDHEELKKRCLNLEDCVRMLTTVLLKKM
ncbi:MAG: hypothetical protein KUG64_11015 [Cycloclasticus sp.]|nr:hypothetical protein [Cycloclasticus sp.]